MSWLHGLKKTGGPVEQFRLVGADPPADIRLSEQGHLPQRGGLASHHRPFDRCGVLDIVAHEAA